MEKHFQRFFAAFAILAVGVVGFIVGPGPAAILVGVGTVITFAILLARRAASYPPSVPRFARRTELASSPATTLATIPVRSRPFTLRSVLPFVLLALVLRITTALVFNLTSLDAAVAPDTGGYRKFGNLIAQSWEDPVVDVEAVSGYKPASAYQKFNAVLAYFVGGNVSLPMSLINCFIGTFAAFVLGRLAETIYGPLAARRAFLLAAFFPSLVLWTSINLREAWSYLAISGLLLAAQRLRSHTSTKDILIFATCLAAIPFIRSYLLLIVALGLVASFVVVRFRQLPSALIAVGLIVAILVTLGPYFGLRPEIAMEDRLATMNAVRQGLASGTSAYDRGVDISTPTGALTYLPKGVLTFLLAPFPWSLSGWRQWMSAPELFIWYAVLVQAISCIVRDMRKRFRDVALPLFVLLIMTMAYGLVEGNEGTAFRHRSQVMMIFFVFAGGQHTRRLRKSGARRMPERLSAA
ncbi:MAG: hypothetical protein H6729_13835 [Deltaproteobacteria bacterium]|nr:hypothetical protein [Deltaproteobacteria bacterium]